MALFVYLLFLSLWDPHFGIHSNVETRNKTIGVKGLFMWSIYIQVLSPFYKEVILGYLCNMILMSGLVGALAPTVSPAANTLFVEFSLCTKLGLMNSLLV